MSEIIYGIHVVKSLLESEPQRFMEVFILKSSDAHRLQAIIVELESMGIAIQAVSRQWLDNKVNGALHQGIVARVRKGHKTQENYLPILLKSINAPLLLVLDAVTDPHNLGACLRSADAAGVHAVIVPRNRSAPLNSIAKKVACGAAESVPLIRVTNLVRTLCLLQNMQVWVVGATAESENTLYQSQMTGPIALLMGAEGDGIRHLTRKHCDEMISIPMIGKVSSLNVSVATGICLFEVVRQRLFSPKDLKLC